MLERNLWVWPDPERRFTTMKDSRLSPSRHAHDDGVAAKARSGGLLRRRKCPNCLTVEPPREIRSFIPAVLFPLRLLLGCVRCDACLTYYFRVRLLNWLFRAS